MTDSTHQLAAAMHKLVLLLRSEGRAGARTAGLSATQAQILAEVERLEQPGVGAIAAALSLTAPTVSSAVSTLVKKGLVEKVRREDDARAVRLALTPAGRAIAESSDEWPHALIDGLGGLGEDERAELLRSFTRLIGSLERSGAIPLSRMCVNCAHFRPEAHPGEARPHHCALIDAPIGLTDLRIDCGEMEPAEAPARDRSLAALG
ncbi:MAG: MarR family winged helix-turn-helix transcriptional regulator [Planctomycetota bacterium]